MARTRSSPRTLLVRLVLLTAAAALAWYWRSTQAPAPVAPQASHAPAAGGVPMAGPTATGVEPATHGFGEAVGFRTRQRWIEHWQKHGREFRALNVTSAEDYLAFAQRLRDAPPRDDRPSFTRSDGVIERFDRATGTFIAHDPDGTIRTCFRPTDGEAYYRRKAERGTP